ncbi:alpha/beta fold hydrolase [Micrococcus luteus]|uniref:alpha/beta fold hydrolase n=2 Tax=Actinomycetes TaxID=1760 RepID=UPI003322B02A
MRWFRRIPVRHIDEGPTVLLLHGIASSSVTFHHVIPLLERTHRCIAIDLLGFGESPAPEWADYTLADHVAAIGRMVASLRLREPFTVVGHSMGALIGAARYAARRRKRVAKHVMVSPPIYLAPHEIWDVIERARMDFYLRLYEYLRTNRKFTPRHAALVQRLLLIPKAVDTTERNWEPFIKSLQHSIESQTALTQRHRPCQSPHRRHYGRPRRVPLRSRAAHRGADEGGGRRPACAGNEPPHRQAPRPNRRYESDHRVMERVPLPCRYEGRKSRR